MLTQTFQQLHASGCFVIPNPWDIGSARYLEHLGFKALATTSAGVAFAMGKPDTDWAVSRDTMLSHIREIVSNTSLPVNADFESGYAIEPEGIFKNSKLCMDQGVAGFSIEDASGNPEQPIFEMSLAIERIRAARQAIDEYNPGVLLTARAEAVLLGLENGHKEVFKRLEEFTAAGADVLYAPGLKTREEISTLIKIAGNKPVNVLMAQNTGLTVQDLADLGVRRISLGSALARCAWGGFLTAAKEILNEGTFHSLQNAVPFQEINGFFRNDLLKRNDK